MIGDREGLGRGCLAAPTDAPTNAPTDAPTNAPTDTPPLETPTRITRVAIEPSDPDATALVAGLSADINGRWGPRSFLYCGHDLHSQYAVHHKRHILKCNCFHVLTQHAYVHSIPRCQARCLAIPFKMLSTAVAAIIYNKSQLCNHEVLPVPLRRLAYDGADDGPADGRTVYCYDMNKAALGNWGTVRA